MATNKENQDALAIFHSGALVRAYAQQSEIACLGGERSSTEMLRLAALIEFPIPDLWIEHIFGENGEGEAFIEVKDSNELYYTAPGGTKGAAVTLADGDTKVLEDNDDDMAIRVSRSGADGFAAYLNKHMSLLLRKPFGTPLGHDNVTDAEREVGHSSYRAIFLKNHGTLQMTLLKVWRKTLGTQQVTDGGQLGGAGAGTITTTGSFADWPASGNAYIKTTGGAEQEEIAYTSRTATVLTVPAAGRAQLGTSATAGNADDTIDATPAIRIAPETPGGSDTIQTIANETTAPTGRTWDLGITAATGVSIGTLATGVERGLWIHRQIAADTTGAGYIENALNFSFTYNGSAYTETISGLFHMAEDALKLYQLWVGEDADPDFTTTPEATSATLPFTFAISAPGGGTEEQRCTVLYQNEYGIQSLNRKIRTLVSDTGGDEVVQTPNAPIEFSVVDTYGGKIAVRASYNHAEQGANAADMFEVWIEADGTSPDPTTDTVVYTESMSSPSALFPTRRLWEELGPYPSGLALKVLVTCKRTGDASRSSNTTAVSHTVGTVKPGAPRQPVGFVNIV